jgi:hypothetical protein
MGLMLIPPDVTAAASLTRLLKQRPDIRAPVAASPTGELGLKVGQAHMIRPAFGVDNESKAGGFPGRTFHV